MHYFREKGVTRVMDNMKFCRCCGAPVENIPGVASHRFCVHCGVSLDSAPQVQAPVSAETPTMNVQQPYYPQQPPQQYVQPQYPPQYPQQNVYGQYNGYIPYNAYPMYNSHIPRLPMNVPALISVISGAVAIISRGAGLLNFPLYIALAALIVGIVFAARKTYRNNLMIAASVIASFALLFTVVTVISQARYMDYTWNQPPDSSYTSRLELAAKGVAAIQSHLDLAGDDMTVSRVISVSSMNQVRIELSYLEDSEMVFAKYAVVEDSALADLGWYNSDLKVTVYEYSSYTYGEEIDVDDVLDEAANYGFTW